MADAPVANPVAHPKFSTAKVLALHVPVTSSGWQSANPFCPGGPGGPSWFQVRSVSPVLQSGVAFAKMLDGRSFEVVSFEHPNYTSCAPADVEKPSAITAAGTIAQRAMYRIERSILRSPLAFVMRGEEVSYRRE